MSCVAKESTCIADSVCINCKHGTKGDIVGGFITESVTSEKIYHHFVDLCLTILTLFLTCSCKLRS